MFCPLPSTSSYGKGHVQPVENAHRVKLWPLTTRPQCTQVCKWVETKIVYSIYYFEGYATPLGLCMICSNRGLRWVPHMKLLNHHRLNSIYSTRHQNVFPVTSHQWPGISNHWQLDCLSYSMFMLISKKSKVCIRTRTRMVLCVGNPPVAAWFPYKRPISG